MRQIISCLNILIKYKLDLYEKNGNTELLCLISAIKIIKTELRPSLPPNILSYNVYQLYLLTLFNSTDIYYKMIEFKIHEEFMNLYPTIIQKNIEIENKLKDIESNEKKNTIIINNNNEEKKQFKLDLENYINVEIEILKILGRIMSSEDGILTKILIDSGISKFLNFVLQSDDSKIKKKWSPLYI